MNVWVLRGTPCRLHTIHTNNFVYANEMTVRTPVLAPVILQSPPLLRLAAVTLMPRVVSLIAPRLRPRRPRPALGSERCPRGVGRMLTLLPSLVCVVLAPYSPEFSVGFDDAALRLFGICKPLVREHEVCARAQHATPRRERPPSVRVQPVRQWAWRVCGGSCLLNSSQHTRLALCGSRATFGSVRCRSAVEAAPRRVAVCSACIATATSATQLEHAH